VPWSVRNDGAAVECAALAHPGQVPAVGGGFGSKFDCALEPFAALLARAAERPVRLVNSRQEEMLTCLCRENAEIWIRSAVTKQGEIVGREAVVLMDCGAYGGEQIFLTTMTAHTLGGNYRLGAVRIASRAIYTNTAPNGAFRACNGVYNTFALERHTDESARRSASTPSRFDDGPSSATGILVRPARCLKATFSARCSIAWPNCARRSRRKD
jgi:CO/xanthine dehydrogenase Mo-binding subunit